ncbi:MAG: hypothetical protein GY870_12510 [archaeon]|nr:hypothetical protein [archaeon]
MSLDDLFNELNELEEKQPIKVVQPVKEKKEKKEKKQKVVETIIEKMKIPDFNDLLTFCMKKRNDDFEIEQFFRHTAPIHLYKKEYKGEKVRSGGGWSGAVKATINILLKMRKEGLI